MTFLSKVFKGKDGSGTSVKSKGQSIQSKPLAATAPKPKWEDAWARTSVGADEVQELLHVCTSEMKSRALDTPFLLLPFRPAADPTAAKYFIRNFFSNTSDHGAEQHRAKLYQEIKLIDPMVICSIMKWCWSRLKGGVVTWNTYELFKTGEKESNMAKHAFDTLIPLSVTSEARKKIIFDFFDLLAAIAANGKANGLGGRKLSRLAGWWAFEHSDRGKGFDGGYKSWTRAADAASHLFFAYLRSLAPESSAAGSSGYSQLPRSLQALVAQTEYPPQTPTLLRSRTPKVVMIVDSVSPTPYALLRRAKHFEYRDDQVALQKFSQYDDPLLALTPECRRVLQCISTANQSAEPGETGPDLLPQSTTGASWMRFEDIGFTSLLEDQGNRERQSQTSFPRSSSSDPPHPVDLRRPATPSWADFLSSGFADETMQRGPPSLLLRPDQILPPINPSRVHSSQSHIRNGLKEDSLEPGELASINNLDLDETFWWVWMSSLANEETPDRKAVFGRCAFLETEIRTSRWMIVEEQLKGAATQPAAGAVFVDKKTRFFSTRRAKNRRQSLGKKPPVPALPKTDDKARSMHNLTSVASTDQQAKVHAAAAALVEKQKAEEETRNEELLASRRARTDEDSQAKTTSVLTLQPVIMKEAAPAIQWARKFDKETIRAKYLGDIDAGKGEHLQLTPSASSVQLASQLEEKPVPPEKDTIVDRDLPQPPPPATQDMAMKSEKPVPMVVEDSPPVRPPPPVPKDEAKLPEDTTSGPVAEAIPMPPTVHDTGVVSDKGIEPLSSIKNPAVEAMVPGVHVEKPTDTPAALPEEKSLPVEPSEPSQPEPTTTTRSPRKLVKSVDSTTRNHPALRDTTQVEPETRNKDTATTKAGPATTAAVTAAGITAWKSDAATASDRSNKLSKSSKGNSRGFRKLFGKKKTELPETVAAQRAMNGSAQGASSQKTVERKSSLMRKKAAAEAPPPAPEKTVATPVVASTEPISTNSSAPDTYEPETQDIDEGEPGPMMSTQTEESIDEPQISPTVTNSPDPNASNAQFSNFSQGVSEDEIDYAHEGDATPVPMQTSEHDEYTLVPPGGPYQTRAAAILDPRVDNDPHPAPSTMTETDYETPMESAAATNQELSEDEGSNKSFSLSQQATVVPTGITADRWAQIRKNAADRRGSEGHGSRQSQSARTDEGETSGEETIESRVARIKARVAELTGGVAPTEKS